MVTYGGIMREYARLRGLRRVLLPVPVLTPRLSGLWLALVTPAQARVGRALVEGLKKYIDRSVRRGQDHVFDQTDVAACRDHQSPARGGGGRPED